MTARLVGQDAELIALAAAADEAAAGRGRIMLLTGDAGIGKSRLGAEAVARWVERLAGRSPVLLFLDDLQWADRGTIELVHYLGRAAEGRPVLILASYRSGETHGQLGELAVAVRRSHRDGELSLAPLPDAAVAELIRDLLGEEPPADLVRGVTMRANGVPLFVTALAQGADRSALRADTLPTIVRDVVLGRLHRLDEAERRLLEIVAVAGDAGTDEVLRAVWADDPADLRWALRQLVTTEVVADHPTGRTVAYRVAHPLYAEVAYAELATAERRGPARQAGHRDRPARPLRRARRGRLAGRCASTPTRRRCGTSAPHWPRPARGTSPSRCRRCWTGWAGHIRSAAGSTRRRRRGWPPSTRSSGVGRGWGQAPGGAENTARVTGGGEHRLRAGHAARVLHRAVRGRGRRAGRRRGAGDHRASAPAARAATHFGHELLAALDNDFAAALAHARLAFDHSEQCAAESPLVCFIVCRELVGLSIIAGEMPAALGYAQTIAARIEETNFEIPSAMSSARYYLAVMDYLAGDVDAAIAGIDSGIAIARRADAPRALARALGGRAFLLAEQGLLRDAEACLVEAEQSHDGREPSLVALSEVTRTSLAMQAGQADQAPPMTRWLPYDEPAVSCLRLMFAGLATIAAGAHDRADEIVLRLRRLGRTGPVLDALADRLDGQLHGARGAPEPA